LALTILQEGAQDNGTQFRDKTGILSLPASDSNNHRRVIGGDGGNRRYFKKEYGYTIFILVQFN
jgi:hypothetical protein